jgi:hypothetical protein
MSMYDGLTDVEILALCLESIRDWCYPEACQLPDNPEARNMVYARRLGLIANAALTGLQKAGRL